MRNLFHERYVISKSGKRTAVIIAVKEYMKILHLLKEAQILKNIQKGEREYYQKKIKPVRSLSELNKNGG